MMDAVDCAICMERPANTALSCGHCFCCQDGCESKTFTTCATCRQDVAGRTVLFGPVTSLHDMLTSKFQMEGIFPKREDATVLIGDERPQRRARGAAAGQSLSLAAGSKVVAHFSGRKGCVGWYDATVVEANEDADEYVVEWDDGEKKDTTKKSSDICVHYKQLHALKKSDGLGASLDTGMALAGVGSGAPDMQAALRAARAEISILQSSLEKSRKGEDEQHRKAFAKEREAFAKERGAWSVEKVRLERCIDDAKQQRSDLESERAAFDRERKEFARERKALARERRLESESWAAGLPLLVFLCALRAIDRHAHKGEFLWMVLSHREGGDAHGQEA